MPSAEPQPPVDPRAPRSLYRHAAFEHKRRQICTPRPQHRIKGQPGHQVCFECYHGLPNAATDRKLRRQPGQNFLLAVGDNKSGPGVLIAEADEAGICFQQVTVCAGASPVVETEVARSGDVEYAAEAGILLPLTA